MLDGDDILKMFGVHVGRRIWQSWDWRWQFLSVIPAVGVALSLPLVLYGWLIHPRLFGESFWLSVPKVAAVLVVLAITYRFKSALSGASLSVLFPGSNLEKKFLEFKGNAEDRLRNQIKDAAAAKGEQVEDSAIKVSRADLEFEMYKQMLAGFFKLDLDRVERRASDMTAEGENFHKY